MSNGVKRIFEPVRSESTGPPEQELRTKYAEMSTALRNDFKIQSAFANVLNEILKPFAESKGELVVSMNGSKCYFEREGKPITNFGVILLSSIQVHYVDHIQHDLELLIWGELLPPRIICIEAKNLRSSGWIDDLGPKYLCETWGIKSLKTLIQAMAQYAPVRDEYMYSGWDAEGGDTYIMGGQPLCGDDWSTTEAKDTCLHALKMLNVAPYSLTIPLLAVALLSLVHSRMVDGGTFFKGVCCIVAPTQSFKTTLASLFFDFANGREADINFEATIAAIVRTIGNSQDSTVIVDDYKPGAAKAENNELVRKLSTVIRMCSDDSGGIQKAGTKNATVSNTAHSLVVVTSEHIQLQVQSTLARLLILEMNRRDVDIGKLTDLQEQHQLYRNFVQDFVRYIAKQGVNQFCELLAQRFLQNRNTLRKELAEDVPVDNRTSDMCTWLWVAFREFLDYAQCTGAITPEQLGVYAEESRNAFLSVMELQAERVADLAPVKQFFRGLQVLLDMKEFKIGELQARNHGYAAADSQDMIGFSKKGAVYLKNGVSLKAVASYYHRFGREFTTSESVLRKALADSGYIIPKDQKSYIHRLSVNHKSYQCIKFERSIFCQLLWGGKQNGSQQCEEFPSDRAMRHNAEVYLGRGVEPVGRNPL